MTQYSLVTAPSLLSLAILGQVFAASEPQYSEPPNQGGVYVIAHRGAHQRIPENTLAAYRKAIELGADFVEIDLRTTKDGEFISIHNRTVDAYTVDGTRGMVSDFTLAEIKSLDIGSRVDPKWSSERVPTVDEILILCKGKIGIYLDLKDAPVDEVANQIKAHGMQRQVVWCISPDQVAVVKRACAECLPMPDPESEETLPRMLEQTAAKIVAPVWRDFSSTFAAKCHAIGVIVFVDEQKPDTGHWQLLLNWGADGIQTDDPEQLIKFLRLRD
jgi:glycerophosphoryl diester phosphodiesterase